MRSGGTRTRSRSGSFSGSAGRRSVPQIVQNCDSSSSHTTVQSLETKSAPATRQVLEAPTTPAPIHTLPDSFGNSSTNTVPSTIARDETFDGVRVFNLSAPPPSSPKSHKATPTPLAAIVSQQRESKKENHTTSRILENFVGESHTTPAQLPTRPRRCPFASVLGTRRQL